MIKVLKSGFFTTIQDLGRFGFRDIGVPVSGAMDNYSAKLGNLILGNQDDSAILEITMGNCCLFFKSQTHICITGADCTAKINNKAIALNCAIKVNRNDTLSFHSPIYGVRTYLAVKGGFQTEKVLGSRSYYENITSISRVQNNDNLLIHGDSFSITDSFASIKINNLHFTSTQIQIYKGPEYELLNVVQKESLLNQKYTVSNENSRMGYLLKEKVPNQLESMLTSAVLPGTVQLTPSGKLIVLMRDCQVTGGYPRILQLTENAINRLAQKTTGDQFEFDIIS